MIHVQEMEDATEPINSAESEREEGELSNDDEDEIIILSEVGNVSSNTRQSLKQIYQNCVRNPLQSSLSSCKLELRPRAVTSDAPRKANKRDLASLGYPFTEKRYRRRTRRPSRSYSRSTSRSRSRSRSRERRNPMKVSPNHLKQEHSERRKSVEILENNNSAFVVKVSNLGIVDRLDGNSDLEDKEDEELELRLAALHSVKVLKGQDSPARWKSTFTVIDQVDESEDEETQLRLAALQSVKAKEESKDVTPVPPEELPAPEATDSNKEVAEDEDEELLRARLLIEVARRQTSVALKSSLAVGKATTIKDEPTFSKPVQEITIPKLAPVVINLQHDSDTSDEEQFNFEASVNQLLRTARQNAEQTVKETLPQALTHLPKHQQEEYYRLKQEIARRTLMQKKETEVAAVSPQVATEVAPEAEAPSAKKVKVAAKPSPLKNLILKKKRDIGRVKTSLTKQFEIVEQNRLEWQKDKDEVARVKQLLQQAEQKEQGSKTLFSASQKILFRLRNDLKSHEDQLAQLGKKVKPQKTKKVGAAARPTPEKLLAVASATPLKVKPQIVAKALQNGTTLAEVVSTKPKFAPGRFSHIALSSQQPHKKKKSQYEEWLFGILGEEWAVDEVSSKDAQPYRSPLYSLYAPPDRRLDPSATLCRYDLDHFCRDSSCKFQHLPAIAVSKEAGHSASGSAKVFVTLPGGMSVVRKH